MTLKSPKCYIRIFILCSDSAPEGQKNIFFLQKLPKNYHKLHNIYRSKPRSFTELGCFPSKMAATEFCEIKIQWRPSWRENNLAQWNFWVWIYKLCSKYVYFLVIFGAKKSFFALQWHHQWHHVKTMNTNVSILVFCDVINQIH